MTQLKHCLVQGKPYKRFFMGVLIVNCFMPPLFCVLPFILPSRIVSCLRAGHVQTSGFSYALPPPCKCSDKSWGEADGWLWQPGMVLVDQMRSGQNLPGASGLAMEQERESSLQA